MFSFSFFSSFFCFSDFSGNDTFLQICHFQWFSKLWKNVHFQETYSGVQSTDTGPNVLLNKEPYSFNIVRHVLLVFFVLLCLPSVLFQHFCRIRILKPPGCNWVLIPWACAGHQSSNGITRSWNVEKDIVSLPVHMKDLKVPVGKGMAGLNTTQWETGFSNWMPIDLAEVPGNLSGIYIHPACMVIVLCRANQVSNMLERPTQPSASFGNLLVQWSSVCLSFDLSSFFREASPISQENNVKIKIRMWRFSFPSTVFAVKTSISLHLLLILLDSIAVAYISSLRKDGLQGGRPRESYEFRCLLVDPTWTHDPKEVGPKQKDSQVGHPWFC